MNKILFIAFCLLFAKGYTQQLLPSQYDTLSYNHEFILNGMAEYSSSALQNDLSQKLIWGGLIEAATISNATSKQKNLNSVGIQLQVDFEYRNMTGKIFGNDRLGWLVKGGYYALGSALYTKDAFGLVFNGNTSYYGETAFLSHTSASFISFQKIGFGILDKQSKSSVSLNYYTVDNFFQGKIRDGKVDQNIDGTAISVQIDGDLLTSQGNDFAKGMGLGLDLDYRFSMEYNNSQKATIQLLAQNFGVANYYTGLQSYKVDTSYHYDGFTFSEVYGDKSIFKEDRSLYDTLNIEQKSVKKTMLLPGFFQIGKIVSENSTRKWQSFFGIRLYTSIVYTPLIYIGAHYAPTNWFEIGTQGSYGGFASFRWGMYANLKVKNWALGIGSQDIYGTLSKNGYGQSLLVRLRCKL